MLLVKHVEEHILRTTYLIYVICTLSLSTICRPSVGAVVTSEVSPLRQVRFTQDDSARLPQLGSNSTFTGHLGAEKRVRTSCVVHLIKSGDVVLDNHRDAVERSEDDASLTLCIEIGGNGKSIRVNLSYDREISLYFADARSVGVDEIDGREEVLTLSAHTGMLEDRRCDLRQQDQLVDLPM